MNFEVNGIPYFLTFDSSEAQWCLLTPSARGIESVEIHNDGAPVAGPWNEDAPHDPRLRGGLN
jgi:hypothetical protein